MFRKKQRVAVTFESKEPKPGSSEHTTSVTKSILKSKAKSGSAGVNALETCLQYAHELSCIAPILPPLYIPRGKYDDGLLAFCRDEEERHERERILQRMEKTVESCRYCHATREADGHGKSFVFATRWNLDFARRRYQLVEGEFICRDCQLCRDTDRIISLCASRKKRDVKRLDKLFNHFCEVNRITDDEDGDQSQRELAQRAFSLAYSLEMLVSDLPGLKILANDGSSLLGSEGANVTLTASQLLESISIANGNSEHDVIEKVKEKEKKSKKKRKMKK